MRSGIMPSSTCWKALVLYVSLEMPPEKRNLGQVYEMLTSENERSLTRIMNSVKREHPNSFTGEMLPPLTSVCSIFHLHAGEQKPSAPA